MTRKTGLLLASIAAAVAAPATAGVYFSAVTTTNGAVGTTVRGWVQGDRARVEITESRSPLLKPGRYLLTLDGGRSVYLVDPAERTFSQWTGEAAIWLTGQAGAALSASWEKLGEEDGGELVGQPTRYARYRATYPPGAGAGMRQGGGSVLEEELWFAPELADAALGIWLRPASADAPDGAHVDGSATEVERYRTFPLKRVAVTTSLGRGSARSVVRTTTTITELSVEEVSPGTFKMGSGFREKALAQGSDAAEPLPETPSEGRQEDQQYPFEEMLQPEPEAAPGEPGHAPGQPRPGAPPVAPATPPPVLPDPEPPQEDPEYPFERMLDTPS